MPYKIENYTDPNRKICKQLVEYYEYCQFACNFTPDTMRGKICSLNHFLRFCQIEQIQEITNSMIYEWMRAQTEKGNGPRTVNNRLKHLRAWLNYCIDVCDMEIPGYAPKKVKKQPEEDPNRRAFTREVIYEALRYADRETWLMIKISFDCGLRINELRNIKLNDIQGDQLSVLGKGRKRRFAILSPEVVVRLDDWVKRGHITDYLWPSKVQTGKPKSTVTMRTMMKAPFNAAGVYNFRPHELRHSYATDLKKLGASTRSIQHGLGHTNEKITEMYLHDLTADSLEELYHLKYSASAPEIR